MRPLHSVSHQAKDSIQISVEEHVQKLVAEIGRAILGKEQVIKLALCCIFSKGHLLIEDLPGMGKTTLSHALAAVLGLDFKRVQFTSDLLPADILGFSIFDQRLSEFKFHPGPIFTQVLLADEINRTTPKTQSALLEAMAEGQVTVEGETRSLGDTFFVIATQNPADQSGTFSLPESQLDRFLMRIEIGYPDPVAERQMFIGNASSIHELRLEQQISDQARMDITQRCRAVVLSDALLDYVQRLVEYSRATPDFACGLSPRGALALLDCAKTWAFMEGRSHVLPEDIQAVLPAVTGHRFRSTTESSGTGEALVQLLLNNVPVIS